MEFLYWSSGLQVREEEEVVLYHAVVQTGLHLGLVVEVVLQSGFFYQFRQEIQFSFQLVWTVRTALLILNVVVQKQAGQVEKLLLT